MRGVRGTGIACVGQAALPLPDPAQRMRGPAPLEPGFRIIISSVEDHQDLVFVRGRVLPLQRIQRSHQERTAVAGRDDDRGAQEIVQLSDRRGVDGDRSLEAGGPADRMSGVARSHVDEEGERADHRELGQGADGKGSAGAGKTRP